MRWPLTLVTTVVLCACQRSAPDEGSGQEAPTIEPAIEVPTGDTQAPTGIVSIRPTVPLPSVWEQGSSLSVSIEALDASGQPLPNAPGAVAVDLLPVDGLTLRQTVPASFVQGRARFDKLLISSSVGEAATITLRFAVVATPQVEPVVATIETVAPDYEWVRFAIKTPALLPLTDTLATDTTTGLDWATAASPACGEGLRQPSRIELLSLLPALPLSGMPTGLYAMSSPPSGWALSLTDNRVQPAPSGETLNNLCVAKATEPRKNAPDVPADQYTQVGTNTVRDTKTALTWQTNTQQCNATCEYPYAQTACANSMVDGYTDWRVPEMRELASLLNLRRSTGPRIAPIFSRMLEQPYWTATAAGTGAVFAVDFKDGSIDILPKTIPDVLEVICVRP